MNIKLTATAKDLSANGGIFLADQLLEQFSVKGRVQDVIPVLKIAQKNSFEKFKGLLLGFVAGAECLDDMQPLGKDAAFGVRCSMFTAKTYGNFLREFSEVSMHDMQRRLTDLSLDMRAEVIGKTASFTVDMDSTSNQQYGVKMQGVEMNKDGVMCLDTAQAFDEFGFPLHLDVREGATYSSQGGAGIVHQIFSRFERHSLSKDTERFVRADSAYCRGDVFEACFAYSANFVITFKENMLKPILHQIHNWQETNKKDEDRIRFYDGRECELGETVYQPEGSDRVIRVVVIRAAKENPNGAWLSPAFVPYDYYAWCTNIGSGEMTIEDIIGFYRKRGHAENFIRELKYGFDLKHYPCLKLSANKAYGLIAAFAHAFMRYIALTHNKDNPHFAKAIRTKFVSIPCIIVRHAGSVVFKFMYRHLQEVKKLLEKMKHQHQLVWKTSVSEVLSEAL